MDINQDQRLHVKTLIMKELETVKVTSKQTGFCSTHNYANDILGNLSRGIRFAWYTISLSRRSLTFENALLSLNWVLRIIFIRELKEKT